MSTDPNLLNRLSDTLDALDLMLLGNENQNVTINGLTRPSISKAIKIRTEEYRTISTSNPNTIPRDGEEWIVTE